MTGLLQAITSIPWDVLLIGVCASCAGLIVPALVAGIACTFGGPDTRRRPTPWVQADLVQLREETDRARKR
jgi:hypothetical protein